MKADHIVLKLVGEGEETSPLRVGVDLSNRALNFCTDVILVCNLFRTKVNVFMIHLN